MRNISVTELEIDKIITSMKIKTSTGFDKISNVIVKASRAAIVTVLKIQIDKSFKSASYPSSLIRVVVNPLYIEWSKPILGNYRPISLLITWNKTFELTIYNRVWKYRECYSLIYVKQFGFGKKTLLIKMQKLPKKYVWIRKSQ